MAYTIAELEEIKHLMQAMVSALHKKDFDPKDWTLIHIANQTPIEEIRAWAAEQDRRRRADLYVMAKQDLAEALDALERDLEQGEDTIDYDLEDAIDYDLFVLKSRIDRMDIYKPFPDCPQDDALEDRRERVMNMVAEHLTARSKSHDVHSGMSLA